MPSYFVGLDLGQTSDPTAVAVLERGDDIAAPAYAVRHLKRYQLGTPYTRIVPNVVQLCCTPPLLGNCVLAVDQTGVGRPVVELLVAEPRAPMVVPITITSGHAVTRTPDGSFHVPKRNLVSILQILLQSRRLKVASGLELAELLKTEMTNFRVKITAAINEVFESWREGDHDDLVLAVALACWAAEREPAWGKEAFGLPAENKSVLERAAEDGVFQF